MDDKIELKRFTTLIQPNLLSKIKLISYFTNKKLNEVIENLQCFPENAKENCDKYMNQVNSQFKMNEMIKNGLSRKESHDQAQNKK